MFGDTVRLIRERRSQQSVRRFREPAINFDARHYTRLNDVREAAAVSDVELPFCRLAIWPGVSHRAPYGASHVSDWLAVGSQVT